MADDLSKNALTEVARPVALYFGELSNLINAPSPAHQECFELTAQMRLQNLRDALEIARQKYEVPLPEEQVIQDGIRMLGSHARALRLFDKSIEGQQLAATLHRTLDAIISEGPGTQATLPALLNFARQYALPPQLSRQ